MRLPDLLDASAARRPHAPAITDVSGGRTIDYGEVAALARRTAEYLTGAGAQPGARIGLIAGNTLACVPIAFGIMAAGGCLVPMAPTLRRAEVDALIAATDLNAIVRVDGDAPAIEMLDPARRPPDGFVELEPAVLRFTSGTTASSKGVILSHRDVLERVAAADSVVRLSADDRVLWTLPLAYHFAVTIVGYIRAGAHILLMNDALPAALVEAASRQRATVLYGSPLQFERMVGSGALRRLPDVRLALSTAAALPAAVAPEFEAAFGVPLGQAYGIIEAGLPCINPRLDDTEPSSVGRPVEGYAVGVFDDDGRKLSPNAVGEVGVRGRGLFSGYYRPWTPRAAVLTDGWFRTGDIGSLDDAGRLTLRGRKKAIIVVAGMKVFAEEVEAVLERLPGVRESRVFAVPHARLGEVPNAEIVTEADVPPPDARALARECAAVLSSYKVPVAFRFVDAISKTPSGKKIRRAPS